jgi:hypothetical protein
MSAEATRTVPLSSKELESAIEVLSSAGHALELTRFERLSYHALMASVDVAAVSGIAGSLMPSQASTWRGLGLETLNTFVTIIFMISTLVGIISLALNIPLFRKAFRRARLKELGLSSLSKSLWQESRRRLWISRARGTLWIVAGIAISLSLSYELYTDRDMPISFYVFVPLLLTAAAALLIIARYLRNQRERMDLTVSAEELTKAFQNLQRRAGTTGVVSVPAKLVERTAKIESAQIAEQRKDAVLRSLAVHPNSYTVAFDRDASEQRATLSVADRVELEDLVAQLSLDRAQPDSPAEKVAGAKDATLRAWTKSKGVEIEYVIDHASRGVRVTALRHGGGRSSTAMDGSNHA